MSLQSWTAEGEVRSLKVRVEELENRVQVFVRLVAILLAVQIVILLLVWLR